MASMSSEVKHTFGLCSVRLYMIDWRTPVSAFLSFAPGYAPSTTCIQGFMQMSSGKPIVSYGFMPLFAAV